MLRSVWSMAIVALKSGTERKLWYQSLLHLPQEHFPFISPTLSPVHRGCRAMMCESSQKRANSKCPTLGMQCIISSTWSSDELSSHTPPLEQRCSAVLRRRLEKRETQFVNEFSGPARNSSAIGVLCVGFWEAAAPLPLEKCRGLQKAEKINIELDVSTRRWCREGPADAQSRDVSVGIFSQT